MKNKIILASSSPARKKLLMRLFHSFTAISPDIDESPLENESPTKMVQRLAVEKAQKIASLYPEALIIASDQVGVIHDTVMGKPLTHEEAVKQLQFASGQTCVFLNGLCLLNSATGHKQVTLETFSVKFRTLDLGIIEAYLKKDTPYHCAGSIKSEGLAIALFESMHGNDPTSLEGLPLIRLSTLLRQEGIEPLFL